MTEVQKQRLKQYKLANGDEIICEFIRQEGNEIIISDPMKIFELPILELDGSPTNVFYIKPWMIYQESKSLVGLSRINVVSAFAPSERMCSFWDRAVEDLIEYEKEKAEAKKSDDDLENFDFDSDTRGNNILVLPVSKDDKPH
jgi:hypothetical protein